jgi:Xaa-Pro aminopeptidase
MGAAKDETDGTLSETDTNTAGHDIAVPDAFGRYMASQWAASDQTLPARAEVADYTERRRRLLASTFPDETLVIPTGNLKVRANDTDYVFRPGSDFFWLTGCHESDAVLLIAGDASATLYLAGRSDRSTPAFYRDRRYGELWVGPRKGVAETEALLGTTCRPLNQLMNDLEKLDAGQTRVLRNFDQTVDTQFILTDPKKDMELAQALSELRLIKDQYEIKQLRNAIAATVSGFEECVRELRSAEALPRGERWIEGTFWRRARTNGNDVGYTSIVACGHHATTLHWVTNDGPVKHGDLMLLDMGVESNDLYTADITRTLPVSGKFTDAQRRLYELVYRAQRAGIDVIKPGAGFYDAHHAAMKVLAEGLEEWGILPVSAAESLKPESGVHRRYTLHSVSHMLGIDVHDCANASADAYYNGTLKPGMVLTVEPGLYFQQDDLTVPEELRGIGVRIEDDVLVTDNGCEVLSAALPTEPSAIEAWMANLQTNSAH